MVRWVSAKCVYSVRRLPVTWQQRNYRKAFVRRPTARLPFFFSFDGALLRARPFGVCQNEYKLPSQHSSRCHPRHTQDAAKIGLKKHNWIKVHRQEIHNDVARANSKPRPIKKTQLLESWRLMLLGGGAGPFCNKLERFIGGSNSRVICLGENLPFLRAAHFATREDFCAIY